MCECLCVCLCVCVCVFPVPPSAAHQSVKMLFLFGVLDTILRVKPRWCVPLQQAGEAQVGLQEFTCVCCLSFSLTLSFLSFFRSPLSFPISLFPPLFLSQSLFLLFIPHSLTFSHTHHAGCQNRPSHTFFCAVSKSPLIPSQLRTAAVGLCVFVDTRTGSVGFVCVYLTDRKSVV